MALTVPALHLEYDAVASGLAMLEKPLTVRCGPVALGDGTDFALEHLGSAGFLVFRTEQAGAPTEVFNENTLAWEANTPVADLKPVPFAPNEDDPTLPWQSILVAAGATDATDAERYAPALSGYPRYFFRAYFEASEQAGSAAALGPASDTVTFISGSDAMLAGVAAGAGETPQDATEIHLFLRDQNRRNIGTVDIINESGDAHLRLTRWDSSGGITARLSLRADGSVVLEAGEVTPGRRATVRLLAGGDLELEAASGGSVRIGNALEIIEVGGNVTLRCSGHLHLDAPTVTT